MTPPEREVAEVIARYPADARQRILALRDLIMETAEDTPGVGPLTETLKWGEPAYLTAATKSGSTIRISWKAKTPSQYGLYFNCQTTLVDTFRGLFPEVLSFEGNRAVVFDIKERLPEDAVRICIAAALTYHRDKKQRR